MSETKVMLTLVANDGNKLQVGKTPRHSYAAQRISTDSATRTPGRREVGLDQEHA